MENAIKKSIDRRHFVTKSLFAGVSCSLGCSSLLTQTASAQNTEQIKSFRERIQLKTDMSYHQTFILAYRDLIIPQLKELSKEIGKDKFLEMLKKATDNVYSDPEFMKRFNSNVPADFWNNVIDVEVLENSANTRTYKIKNCLWANLFREAEAGDIGYALVCYADYANARINNETCERDKTLMQGHDHCLMKWTKNS